MTAGKGCRPVWVRVANASGFFKGILLKLKIMGKNYLIHFKILFKNKLKKGTCNLLTPVQPIRLNIIHLDLF